MKEKLSKLLIIVISMLSCQLYTLAIRADEGNSVLIEEEDYTIWFENRQDTMEIAASEYNADTDWDWSYYGGCHVSFITKGEKGYYTRLGDYIYFCSFESEKLIPLCNRPDCLHDKETDDEKRNECMAYVGLGSVSWFSGIQCYEGKLYANFSKNELKSASDFYYGDDLYEIEADGSSREQLNLQMENASRFFIHRGNVYYVTHITDPIELTEIEEFYRISLDGGDPVKLAEVKGRAILNVYPYGNYVYGYAGSDNAAYLFIYDTESGEMKAERIAEECSSFLMPWGEGYLGCYAGGFLPELVYRNGRMASYCVYVLLFGLLSIVGGFYVVCSEIKIR